jgi:hypothetical protein
MVFIDHIDASPNSPHNCIVIRFGIFIPVPKEPNTGPDENGTKNYEGECKCSECGSADCDEDSAQDQRQNHTYEKYSLVIDTWNGKLSQNDDEYKEIIYR